MHRTTRAAGAALAAAAVLGAVACGSKSAQPSTPTALAPSSTVSLDPAIAEAREGALRAYNGYVKASAEAFRIPDPDYPAQADYVGDPLLTRLKHSLRQMVSRGTMSVGTPTYTPKAAKVDLRATLPTVTVEDCVDETNWSLVMKNNTSSPIPVPGNRRYMANSTVVLYQGKWLVTESAGDRAKTC